MKYIILLKKYIMMKKTILFVLLIMGVFSLKAQPSNQNITTTATLKTSSRLFADKNDLTSVILIIPADSIVAVLDSDSTYLHVVFEDNEGYIFKRQAIIHKSTVNAPPTIQSQQAEQTEQEQQSSRDQQISRFSYLENKYGSNMASRIMSGKIWKGMNAEMVRDSWGNAEKINRVISGNIIKEEWIFQNTWLYFENNTLVEWGQIRK